MLLILVYELTLTFILLILSENGYEPLPKGALFAAQERVSFFLKRLEFSSSSSYAQVWSLLALDVDEFFIVTCISFIFLP